MNQQPLPFLDRDPDCTCPPECEDICLGWCGCESCLHPDADPKPDDQRWVELVAAETFTMDELQAMACDHCGRPSIFGHKPDCKVLGGELDRLKDERSKVQARIKDLKSQIKRLEARA